jgi:hypothetical protein
LQYGQYDLEKTTTLFSSMILCALALAAAMLTGKTETPTDGVPKRRRRREAMVGGVLLSVFTGDNEVEGGI